MDGIVTIRFGRSSGLSNYLAIRSVHDGSYLSLFARFEPYLEMPLYLAEPVSLSADELSYWLPLVMNLHLGTFDKVPSRRVCDVGSLKPGEIEAGP